MNESAYIKYDFMLSLMYGLGIWNVNDCVPDLLIRVGELSVAFNFNEMFSKALEHGFVVREQHHDYFVFTSGNIELCKLRML